MQTAPTATESVPTSRGETCASTENHANRITPPRASSDSTRARKAMNLILTDH